MGRRRRRVILVSSMSPMRIDEEEELGDGDFEDEDWEEESL